MTRLRRARALAGGLLVGVALAACGDTVASVSSRAAPTPTGPTPAAATGPLTAAGSVQIPVAGRFPQSSSAWYLTVGDSITSGFTLDPSRAGVNSGWPVQLSARLAASGRPWQLYDTACPGETTTTYFTTCAQHRRVAALPDTSQYAADLAAITANPSGLKAIVVALGSNDLLAAVRDHNTGAAAAAAIASRLDDIVTRLQAAAPGVPVVVATYYDPFENLGGAELPVLLGLNGAVAALATHDKARLVDFFAVINTPQPPDARLCVLIDCAHSDIHPTVAGHAALAAAVLAVLPTA